MLKIIALAFVATALAGCCVSGNGCYAPVANVPLAWDGLGTAPTELGQPGENRARKTSRPKREIIVGPIDAVAAEPKPKLEGREAYLAQEAADRADEDRLTKKLVICTNCMPRSKPEATGAVAR
jgi:hypothetical protein